MIPKFGELMRCCFLHAALPIKFPAAISQGCIVRVPPELRNGVFEMELLWLCQIKWRMSEIANCVLEHETTKKIAGNFTVNVIC